MTGGVVYLRHDSSLGLTEHSKRRIAKGANVTLQPLSKNGVQDVTELLLDYIRVLNEHEQYEEVALLTPLFDDMQQQFLKSSRKKSRLIHLSQQSDMPNFHLQEKIDEVHFS